MRVNVYERILEWLSTCPEMGTYTYFNVIPIDPGNSSVNSNSSSIILNEFVNGSKEVRLIFNINLVRDYDNGGTSDINLDAIAEFDKVIEFIEKKNNENDYPDLGDNYVVNEIGATTKAPEAYVAVDSPNVARYEGQFYIEYLEKE